MGHKTKAEIRQKFEGLEYPVQIVGRHVEVTEAMKSYAIEKLSKVERLGGNVIDATVVMDIHKSEHHVDFLVNLNGTLVKVSGCTHDMYASIDLAIHRLKVKLSRYLERLQTHHRRGVPATELNESVVRFNQVDAINDAIEEENLKSIENSLKPGEVVAKEKRSLKTLTQEEAIMKMDLSEEPFLVYRDEQKLTLRVIYRRDDHKHYGIIELPE